MDDESLFEWPQRTCNCGYAVWGELSRCSRTFRGGVLERGEVGETGTADRFGQLGQDGRLTPSDPRATPGLALGAGSQLPPCDPRLPSGPAGGARRDRHPRHGVAVPAWQQVQLQKKTLVADEREHPDVKRRRERWQRHQGKIDPTRLVFTDETWVKTNMALLRGWSQRGERRPGAAPFGHWNTSSGAPPVQG